MMTSGSTGPPFEFYWDRDAGPAWVGRTGSGSTGQGPRPGTRGSSSRARPTSTSALRLVAGRAHRALRPRRADRALSADRLSTEALRALVGRVHARGPYYIRGYPGALAGLAARLKGRACGWPATPRWSSPSRRRRLPPPWRPSAEDFARASSTTTRAGKCRGSRRPVRTQPEVLHVNSERVIVRVVRPDGSDAAPGEPGRVVVTDLANRVMPFINYVAGDGHRRGALPLRTGMACACCGSRAGIER